MYRRKVAKRALALNAGWLCRRELEAYVSISRTDRRCDVMRTDRNLVRLS